MRCHDAFAPALVRVCGCAFQCNFHWRPFVRDVDDALTSDFRMETLVHYIVFFALEQCFQGTGQFNLVDCFNLVLLISGQNCRMYSNDSFFNAVARGCN